MARSRLGQNFLFDSSILGRIVDASGISKEDTVVEIGPGPGGLTKLLAQRAGKVVAIELDDTLYRRLDAELSRFENIELVLGDALEFDYSRLGRFRTVANIPYYITTPIIFRLLDFRPALRSMTLTIQKEVAERIVAAPGGKDYGVLSIMVQMCASARLEFIVPKEAFRPVPKVDSAVITMKILDKPAVDVIDEKIFARVVKTAFLQRRKTLSNSLRPLRKDIKNVLEEAGIDPSRRPETLSLEEFGRIADLLSRPLPEISA